MPITIDVLKTIAPHAKPAVIIGLSKYLDDAFHHFEINNKRSVYFLGQAAQESDGFRTLTEYASGKAYEGRHDLGNMHPGDGALFKGRGIFQLTGRANYHKYGDLLGVDLEGHPEFAALPQYAVLTAGQYWSDHGLNELADKDDIRAITKAINGGYTGLSDRKTYTTRASQALNIPVKF
jgi:putative chitinase